MAGRNTFLIDEFDPSNLDYTYSTSHGKSALYLNHAVVLQLNNPLKGEHLSAPFGLGTAHPQGDQNKRQLQLTTDNEEILGKLHALDQANAAAIASVTFKKKKRPSYIPMLKPADNNSFGVPLINTKVIVTGNKASRVWVSQPHGQQLALVSGDLSALTSTCRMTVMVRFWGLWIYGDRCGMNLEVTEVYASPSDESSSNISMLKLGSDVIIKSADALYEANMGDPTANIPGVGKVRVQWGDDDEDSDSVATTVFLDGEETKSA